MVKQISLDSWSLHHLTELLKKGSIVVIKTNTPIVLYRQIMEESEDSYEETVCTCLLYTSPSPRDATLSRMPSSA